MATPTRVTAGRAEFQHAASCSAWHPIVWLGWLVCTMLVVSSTGDPFVLVLCAASIGAVAVTSRRPGTGRALRMVLILGGFFAVARVILFSLTASTGATELFILPSLSLPSWLTGLEFGGPIRAEVVATEVVEASRVLLVLFAAVTMFCVTEAERLVRMVPRRARHAGLVVQVALAFVPSLVIAAREVREAQTCRGYRVRGLRSVGPLVVPTFASALERASGLAAQMQARGFARTGATTYVARQAAGSERLLALAFAFLGVIALTTASSSWSAYPVISWPQTSALSVAMAVALGLPVAVKPRSLA